MSEMPESRLKLEQAETLLRSIVQKEIDQYAEECVKYPLSPGVGLPGDSRANLLESLKQCLLEGVQRSAALLIIWLEAQVSPQKAQNLKLDNAEIEKIREEWQFQVFKNISEHFVGLWMKEKGLTNMP